VKETEARLGGARVLVVEDDPDTLETLMMLLEAHGAEVAGVLSAADALPMLVSFRPDLLLSDIAMPGDDGFTLIRRIRKRTPDEGGRIPAVALSAHVYPEDQQRALAAGFQSFLNKPVTAQTLLRAVRSALEAFGPVERRLSQRRSHLIGRAVPERRLLQRRQEPSETM
jgi:CheY-like chemotaxis protein